MKKSEIRSICRGISFSLPQFLERSPSLMYLDEPSIVSGIYIEGSSFNKESFYVSTFVIPLFVPTSVLYFDFGDRVRLPQGGDRWDITKDISTLVCEIENQALPYLGKCSTVEQFISVASTLSSNNIRARRAVAYSMVRIGRFGDGLMMLRELIDAFDQSVEWQVNLQNEAVKLMNCLLDSHDSALRLLQMWEGGSRKALNL